MSCSELQLTAVIYNLWNKYSQKYINRDLRNMRQEIVKNAARFEKNVNCRNIMQKIVTKNAAYIKPVYKHLWRHKHLIFWNLSTADNSTVSNNMDNRVSTKQNKAYEIFFVIWQI